MRTVIGEPIDRVEDITTPPPRDPIEPVLAIGDSILVGARNHGDLDARLSAAGWIPEIVAEIGKSVNWAIPVVEQRNEVPRTVVVVLGSNPGPGLGAFPDEIARLVAALRERGARRIIWIPPAHVDPTRYAERVHALDQAARLEVPPWQKLIDNDPGLVGGDGLHLTANGYQLLAAFITATVGSPDR